MGSAETWTGPRPLGHTFLKPSQMAVVLWVESCNSRHIIYSGGIPALFHTTPVCPLETPEPSCNWFGWGEGAQ